jgi:methionine salvage enolase-phosphatase E1
MCAFFDTAVGRKTSADSYRRIARELGCATKDVLFVSDIVAELDAARAAAAGPFVSRGAYRSTTSFS